MKVNSKRRRTKQEIAEDKAAALSKEQDIQQKLKALTNLQQQMQELQE